MQRNIYTSSYTRAWFCLLAMGALLLLAACGSNTGSPGPGSTPNATPTSNGYSQGAGYSGGKYGNGGNTTPTASSSKALLQTTTATVSGKSETILTNGQGLTLYYRTSDNPPSSVCSGGCASSWPPLLATGSGAPTSSTSLPGKLTVQATANGNQVEYNGHPLYNFAGDSGPGQTNGEGIANVWFVVTPDLK